MECTIEVTSEDARSADGRKTNLHERERSAAVAEFKLFNQAKATRHGQMLYNVNDIYIGKSLEVYGEYSHLEVELFAHFIRPGDVVIDVGANIGTHTLYFARATHPNGVVIAFEPQRIVFQTLCANMAINSVTNAYCYQQGLSDQPGLMHMPPIDYFTSNNFGGAPLVMFAGGEQVEVNRLDRFNLPHCKLIKIDVEGMELQVLKGASGLIEKHRPVLYVENDRAEKSDALLAYIESIGYRMYFHRPMLFNPKNFFGNPNNIFGNVVSQNLLCFHRSQPQNIAGLPVGEIHRASV